MVSAIDDFDDVVLRKGPTAVVKLEFIVEVVVSMLAEVRGWVLLNGILLVMAKVFPIVVLGGEE